MRAPPAPGPGGGASSLKERGAPPAVPSREPRSGTFAVSLALHGAIAVGAFLYAAHFRQPDAPAESLIWIDTAPEPARTAPKADPPRATPPKAPEPPKAQPAKAAPPPVPRAAPAAAPARALHASGAPRTGLGGGMGVLAGEGAGGGFEMNAEPGDGTGNGTGAEPPPAPPPPPPPPPRVAPPKPKEPPCDGAVTKPRPIEKPAAIQYVDAARADGKEGRLLLELSVGEDGAVGRVAVLSSVHPALDAAAVAAVKTWRFAPATRCGKPTGGVYRVARRFELGD